MMIDKAWEVSTDQALAGTGYVGSTNAVDLRTARDIGAGTSLFLYCRVTTAFVGGLSLIVYAVASPDTDMLNASKSVLGSSHQIPLLALYQNAEFYVPIGPQTRASNPAAVALADAFGTLGYSPAWQYVGALFNREGTFTQGTMTVSLVAAPANFGTPSTGLGGPGMPIYPSRF